MNENDSYLLVSAKALPSVFGKVLHAKQLLASGRARHVREATGEAGISRSVFYKYRDHIFSFNPDARGKTVTAAMNLDNVPGLLSTVLSFVAESGANVLAINQTVPVHNTATANLTLTVEPPAGGMSAAFEKMKSLRGVTAFTIRDC